MSGVVCLGFESARRVWRVASLRVAAANPATESRQPLLVRLLFEGESGIDLSALPEPTRRTSAPRRVHVDALKRLGEEEPAMAEGAQLCISERSARRFVSGATCRLMSGSYPVGSFCRVGECTIVPSPELTFLQMARVLDDDLLVTYGYELCGYFARTPEWPGFCNCPQLTTTARIGTYLESLECHRASRGEGVPWALDRARRALRHVRDGAASPEEAVATMVLSLPASRGGYALPVPRLNELVPLGPEASGAFGIEGFVCDLSWNGGQVVLEYQGAQHKRRARSTYDLRKGNVLAVDGRTVLEMDRTILSSQQRMDELARSVALALGIRWRRPSARVATRRMRLRNKLIKSLDDLAW